MPKNHKQWITIVSYFSEIPIPKDLIKYIKTLLKNKKNILLMIKKEETPKYTSKEKFKHLCELFPEETKTGTIIISSVPDITEFIDID